jgi:hypothetical protein
MAPYDTAKEIFRRAYSPEALRLQPLSDWLGGFLLPVLVAEYFAELGPVDVWIRGYGNPYFLPSLSGLWHYQAGYRYHPDTHERFADWDDDWLVIADQGADPFIFSRTSTVVLHAYHGEGVWEPTEIFACLEEMATTLAIIGDIVESAGPTLTDDASMIFPRYQQDACTRIGKHLHSAERADALLKRLGWRRNDNFVAVLLCSIA